jgi:hypothetical protein
MARISTYDNASPVTLSDKIIGTSVGATPANATKNFLISDLLTLFESEITLQDVLNAGNTATQDIILTGNITQSGGALSLGGTVRDFNGDLGTNGETLVCNASGQLVFGSGLTNQNLEQVLAIGNTATNNIILTGDFTQTGSTTQTGGNYNLTGDFTHSGNTSQTGGDYTLTGDFTQTGNYEVTGNITHTGGFIALTGTVKDSTDTLGSDGEALVSNASGNVSWQDVSTLPSIVRATNSTSFTLGILNQGGVLLTTSGSATDVIIPTNATTAFPVGTTITIVQEGSGTVTISGAVGVTLRSAQSHDRLSHQYSVGNLVKTDTNVWYLYGDIKA